MGTEALTSAIVLDFDGVVIDSEGLVRATWHEVLSPVGIELPDGLALRPDGTTDSVVVVRWLAADLDAATAARLANAFEARNGALCDELPLADGMRDLFAGALDGHWLLAIASGNEAAWVEHHLARLDVARYFSAIVCADGPIRPKPHPDVYLRVRELLHGMIGPTVVVEDSFHGLASAAAAGLPAYWLESRGCRADPPVPHQGRISNVREAAGLLDRTESRVRGQGARAGRAVPIRSGVQHPTSMTSRGRPRAFDGFGHDPGADE